MSKIMLIDGNSIINRAFYGLPILTNKNGEYTNGVYGFLNIFFKLYDDEKPDYVAVAFDLPKPTFRHLKFTEYKGTRKSMPEELRPQFQTLKNLLSKMNIQMYEVEGFEADDILGTLAVRSEKNNLETVIVSGDRDLLQLASKKIKVRIPKTKGGKTVVEDYYEEDVIEKLGVTPKEYIDVKALMGDASDNIPGVPGIGEKTATKIIQEYKSIEAAIEAASDLKPKKAAENLITFRDQAVLSKELATINTEATVDFVIENTGIDNMYNNESLDEIARLDFKTLIPRFRNASQKTEPTKEYKIILNIEDAKKELEIMSARELIAVYPFVIDQTFLGVSFSYEGQIGSFIKANEQMNEKMILELIQSFLVSKVKKILLDSKKDMVYLRRNGLDIDHVIFDTMLAAYLISPSNESYAYSDIAANFLNETYMSLEEFQGKGKNKSPVSNMDSKELAVYACNVANVIFRAYPEMHKIIIENSQEELYYKIELPLAEVLCDMELTGIKVNKEELIEYGENLDKHIGVLTSSIYELAGENGFNINSPMQLGVILFEKLGLKGTKKTTKGYSTAGDVLEKLVDKHPIIRKIIDYRTYTKLKSTYVEGLLHVIDEKTDKIYSTFNQAITTTGRISSTEPNLQNIPIRLELGRRLRKVFVPTDDQFVFLDSDYSQIELRVLAHMADDEILIKAFNEGEDIHRLTASQVFKTPIYEVTSEQRSNAKAVNFGIVYGISAFSLSQDLKITKKEADKYIEGYFEKYPSIKRYLDNTIKMAKENGYAATIFNRRRYIPELASSNFIQRSFGERVAMNMPVQGSAADIIKIAMVSVYKRLKEEKLESRILLQVHDELLLEVKKEELERVKNILKSEMENAVKLKVRLETDFHVGKNWFDAK